MKDVLLSKYHPNSELVVECHQVTKPKFPVVDFHTHYGCDRNIVRDLKNEIDLFDLYGVAGVVNLDGYQGQKLDKQLEYANKYNNRIIHFGWVDVTKIDDKDFGKYAESVIKMGYKKGIRGLKFFKTLSLNDTDSKGDKIRIDDRRLNIIWETAALLKIPVLVHIADPVAFFKPIDEKNERFEQLVSKPEWSFYGDEYFSFEQLMEMQENLLENNPQTNFVIAHVGSYSENLAFVSAQMDRHPNMYVDISARVSELGRQPYTARKFMINYQDRILFGTDNSFGSERNPIYYRFLETWDEYFNYAPVSFKGRWQIYGIGLPDDVLEKVYNMNALKLVPEFKDIINKQSGL